MLSGRDLLDIAAVNAIDDELVLFPERQTKGLLVLGGTRRKGFLVADFYGPKNCSVRENATDQKGVCSSPVFGLDVIRFSPNHQIRIETFEHVLSMISRMWTVKILDIPL